MSILLPDFPELGITYTSAYIFFFSALTKIITSGQFLLSNWSSLLCGLEYLSSIATFS